MAKAKSAKSARPAKAKPAPKSAKQATSVFDHLEPLPKDAWGLRRAPKFAASEQAGALLGLGFPHGVFVSSEPVKDTSEAKLLKLYEQRVVPRGALEPLYRFLARKPQGDITLAGELDSLIRNGSSVDVWILEAMFGGVAVATALVDKLASYGTEQWSGDNVLERSGWSVIRGLAFTLWRVPAAVRDAQRAKLESIFQRVTAAATEWWRPLKALDLILHGRAGCERSKRGYPEQIFLSELLYTDDDPGWVAKQALTALSTLKPADREWFDVQLAVIAGPTILDALRANTHRFKADQKKWIANQLSLCA